MARVFNMIEVRNLDGGKVDPRDYGLDVEYIEQEKTPGGYVSALFGEIWHTGKISENDFNTLVSECSVYGLDYSAEFFLGGCSDYVIQR